jgi:hypothetical protein
VRLRSKQRSFNNKRALKIHLYMLHYKCARVPKRVRITIIMSAAKARSRPPSLSLSLSLSLSRFPRAAVYNILKTALFLLNSAARLLLFDFHNRRIDVRLDDLLEH